MLAFKHLVSLINLTAAVHDVTSQTVNTATPALYASDIVNVAQSAYYSVSFGAEGVLENLKNSLEGTIQDVSVTTKSRFANLSRRASNEYRQLLGPLMTTVDGYTSRIVETWEARESIYAKIQTLETNMRAMTSFALSSESIIQSLWMGGDVTSCQFLKELDTAYQTILIEASTDANVPASADIIGHEKRSRSTITTFEKVENEFLLLAAKYGLHEAQLTELREYFDSLAPYIESIVVTTGDLAEQHPLLLQTILYASQAMIFFMPQELWFLRTFLQVIEAGQTDMDGMRLVWDLAGMSPNVGSSLDMATTKRGEKMVENIGTGLDLGLTLFGCD